MRIARRWGCTPAAVRECTLRELRGMVAELAAEDEEQELREQRLAEHYPEMKEEA